jgi:hypothetical protein
MRTSLFRPRSHLAHRLLRQRPPHMRAVSPIDQRAPLEDRIGQPMTAPLSDLNTAHSGLRRRSIMSSSAIHPALRLFPFMERPTSRLNSKPAGPERNIKRPAAISAFNTAMKPHSHIERLLAIQQARPSVLPAPMRIRRPHYAAGQRMAYRGISPYTQVLSMMTPQSVDSHVPPPSARNHVTPTNSSANLASPIAAGHIDRSLRIRSDVTHSHFPDIAQSGSTGSQAIQGDVYLDGHRMGHWLGNFMASDSRKPPAGVASFDTRVSPIWPGRKPAF